MEAGGPGLAAALTAVLQLASAPQLGHDRQVSRLLDRDRITAFVPRYIHVDLATTLMQGTHLGHPSAPPSKSNRDNDRYAVLINALGDYADMLEQQIQQERDADAFEGRTDASPVTDELQKAARIAHELAADVERQIDA